MKKGKTVKLNGFRNSKVSYGTVDSKDLKSLYLNIQTWVEPKEYQQNWDRVVLNMNRAIKHSVYNNLDKNLFNENFIVDLDLRTSGLQLKKKSFMNLEVNLYVTEPIDFKSLKLKKTIRNLVKDIYSDVLIRNKFFKFYLTKYGNSKSEKIKTQTH